jgi:hypothetical protein
MRFLSHLVLVPFILLLNSCSPKTAPYSAQVNFLYKDSQGTIGVKSLGFGTNRSKAIADAQKNAFNVILFKGIPGTELNLPLVPNESAAKQQHGDYFKNFFDKEYYNMYMMSSTESSNLIKVKGGGNKISVDVKINYVSLRRDLEQNNVIRKFGY